MSAFLDRALPLAERGFRVFPLIPKDKRPLGIAGDFDHFDAASTDIEQLRVWNEQVFDANVGLAPDEIFCFLETDDEAALKEACADIPPEVWDTTRVSARANRCYFIFRQTMRTKRAGNMTVSRKDKENLFEFKQHRVYVTGPGSIHPKTNAPYGVEWRPIPAMPDVLLNRLCELYGAPKASESHAMSDEVKRGTALLDRFLECYEVAATGDWFNKGKQWYRPIECPWRDEHENPNEGTSTCIVLTEGGGYGFDCKHRCSEKGWKEFRAELESRFPERKFSFVADDVKLALGGRKASAEIVAEDAEQLPPAKRPVYPDDVWADTFYGIFAELCSRENYIPKRLFTESIRTTTGAIVGRQLRGTTTATANPRAYTILITGPGGGKGTACERVQQLFAEQWSSNTVSVEPPFLFGVREIFWRNSGLGVQIVNAASAPGIMKALEPRKLKKNEVLNPMEVWKPVARYMCLQEEVRALFANFQNESTGAGLESVLCELYDRETFATTATKDRAPEYGTLMYSILGGITPENWDSVFSKVASAGSGFLSRLNIIGTEEARRVQDLDIPDFTELRNKFFPLIKDLAKNPRVLSPSADARQLVTRWFDSLALPEGVQRSRLNVLAWRTSLHLAWLHGHDHIEAVDAEGGTRVADYQVKMREYYSPAEGETRPARCEAAMRKVMRAKRHMTERLLMRAIHYEKYGVELARRSLENLCKAGELRHDKNARPKIVILLKDKD
jgi:hypothetical protein